MRNQKCSSRNIRLKVHCMYVHLQITMVRLKLPETDIVMVTETLLFSIQSDVHELQRWYHNTYSDFP